MTKPYDDSKWREEYKGYTSSKYELDLLENGPHSLSQSWMMGALYNKWKKMKGYKDPEPPDCQSSFSEFSNKYQQYKVLIVETKVYDTILEYLFENDIADHLDHAHAIMHDLDPEEVDFILEEKKVTE